MNNLPFWISEVETDIRKDPQAAFEEEQERKAANELIAGSLLGTLKAGVSYKAPISSPLDRSFMQPRLAAEESARRPDVSGKGKGKDHQDDQVPAASSGYVYGTLSSVPLSFSISKYAQSRREREVCISHLA
jgi:hypothetical protein